jgi:GntR family transcriptional regulator/MocR family aminotransferase
MIIPIERRGPRPVFRQIVDHLRRNIESGRLPAGTKLRPIRLLASELGVNRETVADAYRELETLGLTQSGVGRGTFVLGVAAPGSSGATGSLEATAPEARPFVPVLSRAAEATLALPAIDYGAEARAVRFERVVPDPSLYPVDDFRKACTHVLRHGGRALLDYGDPRGHEGLRRLLVERLTAVGIEADPDAIVLTAGSTQALTLVTRVFCDPGDAVVVEEPTYAGACAAFAALGVRPVAVPVRERGLDLDALDTLLARGRARLLYTMPSFHNPTGITTTLEHRRRLLEIAARHGVAVLEDDFEKDMRARGRPVPPLKALDRAGQVIYVGTFSKTLFPGVRIGWIVGPPRIAEAALVLKRATDLASSIPLQAAVAHFCHTGAYDRHLRRVAKELARRLDRASSALEAHLPEGSTFTRPEGGFAIWVTLPADVDTMALLPDAKRAGVVYSPGAIFYTDGRRSSSLRLSIGQAGTEDIESGVRALCEAARSVLPRGGGREGRAGRAAPAVHV